MLELITLLWLTLHLNRDARNEEEGEKKRDLAMAEMMTNFYLVSSGSCSLPD